MNYPKPKLAFALLGDITKNSRALRQISALAKTFTITAVGFSKTSPTTTPTYFGKLILLAHPPDRGLKFFSTAHRRLTTKLQSIHASVFHASDLYSLMASRAAARKLQVPYTYDARELYSEVDSIRSNPVKRAVWRKIESFAIRDCHHVFTVSVSISRHLATLHNIIPPTVVYNTPDLSLQRTSNTVLKDIVHAAAPIIILHNGQIRRGRGCTDLVRAFGATSKSALVFMGTGPQKEAVQQIARSGGYDNRVYFIDPVPPDEVIAASSTASLGVTLLEDTCLNHRLALPNKLFEYAAAGVPVLGSDLPEISLMINDHGIGKTVDLENETELRHVLLDLENNPGQLSLWKSKTAAFSETFGWKQASQAFLEPFIRAVNPSA